MKRIQYDPKNDYYERMGVTTQVSLEELQQTYRKKAKKLHPDLNPPEHREWATSQFQLLNEAYDVLSDPATRQDYDRLRLKFIGAAASQPSPTTRRTSPGDDWWNVPHPRQPGYDGVKMNTAPPTPIRTRTPPKTQAAWLDQVGLGFIKPFYLGTLNLIISPYRWLLILLVVALLLNLLFIFYVGMIESSDSSQEQEQQQLPTQSPVVSVAEGNIPTPNAVIVDVLKLIPCPEEAQLLVYSYEQVDGRVLVSARIANDFMARDVMIRNVNGMDRDRVLVEGNWQSAELYLTVEEEIEQFSELPTGPRYLLQWTPIPPNGSSLEPCQQVIVVK